MRRLIILALVLLVPSMAIAQEVRGTLAAPGFAGEFVLRPIGPPTPRPTITPTASSTNMPPAACRNGTLNRPLADGGLGRDDVFIREDETHVYCLPLPKAVRSIVVNEYDQCLGTNVQLTLRPPAGAMFSTGAEVPTTIFRSTARLGNSRSPAGFIPGMVFILEITGGPVGPNCLGGQSKYDLRWYYVD